MGRHETVLAVAAWLAAGAVLVIGPRRRPPPPSPAPARSPRRPLPFGRAARPAALLAGLAVAAMWHPAAGIISGAAGWWLLPAIVARLDTSDQASRRLALARQLPMAAGLLSTCLAAGSTLAAALTIAADAMPDPAGDLLDRAARTALLGGGPAELAEVLADAGEPGWQDLGAAVVRSSTTGAPLAALLHDQADKALQVWSAAAATRARGASVKAVIPLALCFLPAFLLLGVAPLIAGLLSGVTLP